jgi:mRNA interferase MazF
MAVLKLKRGDVWWVNLDSAQGSEIKKRRPAIVVSNNLSNLKLDRIQVVPLTTNTKQLFVSECLVTIKQTTNKALANQIRTVSTKRLGKRIGALSNNDLQAVENVVRLQLGL